MNDINELQWGMTPDQMKEAATKTTEVPQLKGAYKCIFYEAVRGLTQRNAEYVRFAGQIEEVNNLNYVFRPEYLFASDSKNREPLFGLNTFLSLRGVLGLIENSPKTKLMNARVWDRDLEQFITKMVEQFFEVLHKPVGIVAITEPVYRRVKIDGYTKRPVSEIVDPTDIYFPDYNDIVGYEHRILKFFDHKTGLTYAEMQKKSLGGEVSPQEVDSLIQRIYSKKEKIRTVHDLDNEAEKILKRQLDDNNIPYNKQAFVSFAKYGGNIPTASFDSSSSQEGNSGISSVSHDVPF